VVALAFILFVIIIQHFGAAWLRLTSVIIDQVSPFAHAPCGAGHGHDWEDA
jgi:hypothetical protein